jgi:P pilus assembly chaperone PapD
MLCNFIKSLFVVICLLNMSLSYAGVIIGGTRVIFNSDRADETFSIFNKETNVPYLIQVWVEPFDKKETTPPPFTAIPPVSRLEPQQEKILRIIKTKERFRRSGIGFLAEYQKYSAIREQCG